MAAGITKTALTYFRERVQEVVRCTNGQVSTRLQKRKKNTGLTDAKKYQMILDGRAELRPMLELMRESRGYRDKVIYSLLESYTYPTTSSQQVKIDFNNSIDSKIEEIHTEIELEGKRLIDKVVLGILPQTDVPDALLELGNMVKLASTVK